VPMRLALDRSSAAQQTYQGELAVVTHACRKLTIPLPTRGSIEYLLESKLWKTRYCTNASPSSSTLLLNEIYVVRQAI
jgi:hypothetical protein